MIKMLITAAVAVLISISAVDLMACGGGGQGWCNGPGGNGGYNRGTTGQSGSRIDWATKTAKEYYGKKYGDSKVTIQVNDYGCHMEASVIKNNKIVKRLSLNGNQVNEIE